MERKVNFPNQSFDIAVIRSSATTSPSTKGCDLLDQLPQVITDKATRDLHDGKSTVTRLGDVTEAQDIRIQFFKSLAQLIRWWWLKVGWKWVAIGHRRG